MEESYGEETQSTDDYGLTEAELAEEAEREAERLRIEAEREAERQRELAEREAERLRIEAEEEAKRQREREIYNMYINNDLRTGSTPYRSCYGRNSTCNSSYCSEVSVRASNSSDVIVTLKQGGEVVRHAYIKRGQKYTFSVPNGTYQPFFYYGRGWNPEKTMPSSSCSNMKGGFISSEDVGKDDPQTLSNHILSYELVEQVNGNFPTRPSNKNEAF